MKSKSSKKILVAPLNWGLGHATRCIPIINALLKCGFSPILASDGAALTLLRKEFPQLPSIELPNYGIRYAKNRRLKWQLIKSLPRILKAVRQEKKLVMNLSLKEDFCGIISDNRFGVYHPSIPSVYITHQLNVLSGSTTWITSLLHRRYIKKFDECWVPDQASHYLSGNLTNQSAKAKFVGVLSRLNKAPKPISYDFLIVLSGPEPQRTMLEHHMINVFSTTTKRVLLLRGVFEDQAILVASSNLEIRNYALANELETLMNSSEVIIARSGYSTILDLAKLQKRAFFIPTPGQYEQVYLANHMQTLGIAPFTNQGEFTEQSLDELQNYTGFTAEVEEQLDPNLFKLFKGK